MFFLSNSNWFISFLTLNLHSSSLSMSIEHISNLAEKKIRYSKLNRFSHAVKAHFYAVIDYLMKVDLMDLIAWFNVL